MSKPSILLVPGSFALPEFYEPVINAVAEKGYEIQGLHKPSVGPTSGKAREGVAPPTMYDDAAFIAGEVEKLANQGKDVILLAHSYGGVPVTQSTKGLSKKERQREGKEGGIVNLAYMTCLVPAVGQTAKDVLATVPQEQQLDLKIDENGWMYHDPVEASAALVFSDIPKEEGEAWIRKFPRHSSLSFIGEVTHAGYKDIPVSYLLCENDLCIPANVQRDGIDLVEKESGRKVDVTSIKADHCPMAAQPEVVIEWILNVAAKY
ncbi:uncharacterized protein A1O5_09527 [Cladophialophora psammophila CBS 110553]|uniref:AB hydrolase-1 domain-containing protein n=1 Tax=Cladophialophora psammophila CBS 110553 TaxID=1182543 RepID=W9XAP6_9EURO|nr:uncharacterized protein A1O5_09527 [Cladophialophora psammophila CBS 110553]EXJ67514.1 hypothetical protein A1O5_09527 [Cladophialophora psammophila CBS 110553]